MFNTKKSARIVKVKRTVKVKRNQSKTKVIHHLADCSNMNPFSQGIIVMSVAKDITHSAYIQGDISGSCLLLEQ